MLHAVYPPIREPSSGSSSQSGESSSSSQSEEEREVTQVSFPECSFKTLDVSLLKQRISIRPTSNHLKRSNAAAVIVAFPIFALVASGDLLVARVARVMPPLAARII